MAFSEVDDVDVVADAGAVVCRVVVAENSQQLQLADGDLGNVRHEIVGLAVGVFADAAADVRSDGVEVAQRNYVPTLKFKAKLLKFIVSEF